MAQDLRLRLKYEKKFLEDYFNGEEFPMKRKNGEAIFERKVTTRNGNVYVLRIYVGPNYPFELPKLVVRDSPKPMPKSCEWQRSHITHTWEPKDGYLQICFFRPRSWTRKNRLYEVFNKGEEWLEAYEEHLSTGKKMNEMLFEMEPSEEECAVQRRETRKEMELVRNFNVQYSQLMNFLLSFAFESGLTIQDFTNQNNLTQIESTEDETRIKELECSK